MLFKVRLPTLLHNHSTSSSVQSQSLQDTTSTLSSCSDTTNIEEILALPKARVVPSKTRAGLTTSAHNVSGTPFLQKLHIKKVTRDKQAKGRKKLTKRLIKSPKIAHRKRTTAARVRARTRKKGGL